MVCSVEPMGPEAGVKEEDESGYTGEKEEGGREMTEGVERGQEGREEQDVRGNTDGEQKAEGDLKNVKKEEGKELKTEIKKVGCLCSFHLTSSSRNYSLSTLHSEPSPLNIFLYLSSFLYIFLYPSISISLYSYLSYRIYLSLYLYLCI